SRRRSAGAGSRSWRVRDKRAYLKLHAADNRGSATPKLIARGRTGGHPRTLVLMTEDQAALVKVVGRHFDGHAIAGQRLNPVLLHLAGRVSHDFVAGVELNAIAGVRQNLDDEAFELDEFFLGHFLFLWIAVFTAARVVAGPDLAMQESDGGNPVCS